ncbi:hemolysin family protein [Sedimenticola hydrogenitrophicus]|uniref:hemolysin family protein n=1 Tax=Sedimenticola hydrogenitrophicus TaxID=2967975 RepID=UPI0023AEAB98|nr:hemolysin family protein [Sedimenticola hydrogenitrophicus]
MSLWIAFIVIVLLLINALYVAAEFAAVGARVTRVERLAAQGQRLAVALLPTLRDPLRLDRYIAACQLGITLSSLVLGAFGQATIGLALGAQLDEHTGLEPLTAYALSATITLVVLTSIQVVFGELIPRTVALQYPVGTAICTYLPLRWSITLLAPFITLLNGSGSLVLRLFGVNGEQSHRHVHSPEEIDLLIRESREGGLLEQEESKRLREALQLGQHRVRQLMVHSRQIASLDLSAPPDQLLADIEASPYTRLIVHRGNPDEILGYIHVKDVAVAIATDHDLTDLQSLVRPLLIVPYTLTIDRALNQLCSQRARIALLADEYGDIKGLVSLQDIIHELLGGLSDEFKSGAELASRRLPDGRWRLPGRLPLNEVDELIKSAGGQPLKPGRADTLAGWLLERLDTIPEGCCCLTIDGIEFEIESLEGLAIGSVLVRIPQRGTGGGDA